MSCATLPVTSKLTSPHGYTYSLSTHYSKLGFFFSPSVISFLLDTKPSPTSAVNNSGRVTPDPTG